MTGISQRASRHPSHRWEEDDQGGIVAEINITPLTDIFLVLLIIFMVSTTVLQEAGSVQVSLPTTQQNISGSPAEGVLVTLLPNADMQVNLKPIPKGDWAQFEAVLKKAFQETRSHTVILEGDKNAFLGAVIEVMDVAKRAGAEAFAVSTSVGP